MIIDQSIHQSINQSTYQPFDRVFHIDKASQSDSRNLKAKKKYQKCSKPNFLHAEHLYN